MKITEDKIQEYIQLKYNYLISKYSRSNILGVFTVGIANYGFAEIEDKITTVAIYIPTFNDLCLELADTWKEQDIIIIDIRKLYNVYDTCKWGALELLFSDYKIINPIYNSLFNNFIEVRDKIAECEYINRVTICGDRAAEALDNNPFEAARLDIACDLYLKGVKCEDIFHLKKECYTDYLWDIKHGIKNIDKAQILLNFENMKKEALLKNNNRQEADNIIKNGIVSIISTSLKERVSIDTFYSELTKTEIAALKEILNRLDTNGNGNISISKIVEETNISRPVFKNLFIKLEKNKIAKINNQGVKGTSLHFDMSVFN